MNDLEALQSRLRESQQRLREVRTENGELKIQYRRWLFTAVCLSMASMVICLALMLFDTDPLSDLDSYTEETQEPVIHLESDIEKVTSFTSSEPFLEVEPPEITEPASNQEDSTSLEVEMPGWDEPEPDPVEDQTPPATKSNTFTFPKAETANPTPPPTTGAFLLPGSSSTGKRVIHHRVRKYDTLWKILEDYQGSPPTLKLINKIIKDNGLPSSRIQPGSELIIILNRP
jgi:hypothetical protein